MAQPNPRKLNHKALKRTQSLLSEIDLLLSAPTIAERVDNTLYYSAPDNREEWVQFDLIDSMTTEQIDLWICFTCDNDALLEPAQTQVFRHFKHGRSHPMRHRHEPFAPCGCALPDEATWPFEDGERVPWWDLVECKGAEPEKVGLFITDIHDDSAAPVGCGVESCNCTELFERTVTNWL